MFGAKKYSVLNKKRIWVVSEMFYPEEVSTAYIMTCISEKLAETAEVHIICGPIGYDKITSNQPQRYFNFIIHRIKTINFSKNNVVGRLIRSIILSVGIFFKGLFSIKKTDTVFTVTNPAFVIPFYAFIKKIRKCKLIILVHDVFPENLISSKIISSEKSVLFRIARKIFNWSYKQADDLIVLGADMLEVMSDKIQTPKNISIIQNWADTDNIKPLSFFSNSLIAKYQLQDKIVFTFAGNLGRVQGLEFLFNVIKKVVNKQVHFIFIGDGALLATLQQQVVDNKITCVTFAGTLPRNEQNVFLNAAHFGLVTLAFDLYGLGVPSKSYNVLAAGKPILFVGNKRSEIAKMVVDEGCGFVFDDEDSLLDFFNSISHSDIPIIESMGKKSRTLAETKYTQVTIIEKFKKLINSGD